MLLHHRFIRMAKMTPKKLAIVDGLTGKKLTFQQALISSLILAKKFPQSTDSYIGIMLPNSAGCFLSVIASLFCHKIPVMINYSTGAARNIEFARRKCEFHHVLTSRKFIQKLGCPEVDGMIFLEDLILTIRPVEKLRAAMVAFLPIQLLFRFVANGTSNDTAVIMFTSGSEKTPKGVELSHGNITSNIDSIYSFIGLSANECMSAILPAFHVYGFTTGLWLPMIRGNCVVTYGNPLEAKMVVKLVKAESVTVLIGTPFFLMNYARAASADDFSKLRFVMSGADKIPESLFETYQNKYQLDILEGYGTTETSPIISANPLGAIRRGSIGFPIDGVEVKIVDVNSGKTLPANQEGKIMVRGDLLMKGYFKDKKETTEKIKLGWYETGDMGLFDDDGYLWHKGRLKRFVKIGGEMVSLVNVETEIEKLLPEDVECCVIDHPDEKKGAVIVVVTSCAVDESEIKKQLRQVLAAIAVPKHFLVMENMPKMGSGKIDFRQTTVLSLEMLAEA